jgi:hypothetical protein
MTYQPSCLVKLVCSVHASQNFKSILELRTNGPPPEDPEAERKKIEAMCKESDNVTLPGTGLTRGFGGLLG